MCALTSRFGSVIRNIVVLNSTLSESICAMQSNACRLSQSGNKRVNPRSNENRDAESILKNDIDRSR